MFPDQREAPLTSAIFKIPLMATNLVLQNDSSWLESSDYIYARGVRNAFDISYDASGNLFGVENSDDRDDPDELNWLRENHHYGFPWVIGDNFTGQQFPWYDPAVDLLINHNSLAWSNNKFYNDPSYPVMPTSITPTPPVRNIGPDAGMWRDPDTGTIFNMADSSGFAMRTFTAHKSPLGLVFDKSANLGGIYTGDAFVLGYTKGCTDSSGFVPGYGLGPFLDGGEDLLHLKLEYDPINDNFVASVTRIAAGFTNPVDADLVGNIMYVIENNYPGSPDVPMIWKIVFPLNTTQVNEAIQVNKLHIVPNPSNGIFHLENISPGAQVEVYDMKGVLQRQSVFGQQKQLLDLTDKPEGMYVVQVTNEDRSISRNKLIISGKR